MAERIEESARSIGPVDRHVGNRIRLRRMIVGMSQEKLAAQLSVSFQQVQKIERGQNRIGAGRLFEVARILEVEPGFFYQDLAMAPASTLVHVEEESEISRFLATHSGATLMRSFFKLSPAARRMVANMVRMWAKDFDEAEAVEQEAA